MSSLAECAAAAGRCAEVIEAAAFRNSEAVGIGLDSFDDPHCCCIVFAGEVVYEAISPGLARLPAEEVEDVVRAVRFMARGSWLAQTGG